MGQVRFIADVHFGHKNCAKWRGFDSAEEHDEYLIQEWNKVVLKRDTVYLLGDLSMENKKYYHLIDRLNGLINVVLGNHDRRQDVPEMMKHVNSVAGAIGYKGYFLTHCPMHKSELRYRNVRGNIHGHIHDRIITKYGFLKIPDKMYINVACEQVGYQPKTLEELLEK